MGLMEEKRLLDQIVELKQEKVQLLAQNNILLQQNAGFAEEKSNMLCFIAILVDRDGGRASVTQLDGPFVRDWQAGKIVLDVSGDLGMYKFSVRRINGEGQSSISPDGDGSSHGVGPGNGTPAGSAGSQEPG